MKKHWIKSLLAALVMAALLSSVAAVAEAANDVEITPAEAYVVETEVELIDPNGAEKAESAGKDAVANGTVSVSKSSVTTYVGESVIVTVTYRLKTGKIIWNTGDTDVATCQWGNSWYGSDGDDIDLTIFGNGAGTTTITITNDQNSDKAKIKVKVKKSGGSGAYSGKGKKDGKTKYRALLIGEEAFDPICTRNRGDVGLMEKMLKSVKGPKGGSWTITKKFNLSRSAVLSAIYSAFKKADEDDVTLFFIATHGDTDSTGDTAGALAMIPEDSTPLLMGELASALKAVPGKIIVVLESCGAGAGVFGSYGEQNANAAKNAVKNAAKAFDNAAIDAFAAVDTGIVEGDWSNAVAKGESLANTGEFRVKNKFYVLAAARYQELSWGTEDGPYNYFTKWLTNGVGTSGRMPADSNKNGKLTLKELFKYISKVGDNYGFYSDGRYYYQHVQAYPKSSSFDLFKR